jgi:hypothetical protein
MVEGYSNHMHFSIKDSCRVDAMAISEKLLRKVILMTVAVTVKKMRKP